MIEQAAANQKSVADVQKSGIQCVVVVLWPIMDYAVKLYIKIHEMASTPSKSQIAKAFHPFCPCKRLKSLKWFGREK